MPGITRGCTVCVCVDSCYPTRIMLQRGQESFFKTNKDKKTPLIDLNCLSHNASEITLGVPELAAEVPKDTRFVLNNFCQPGVLGQVCYYFSK